LDSGKVICRVKGGGILKRATFVASVLFASMFGLSIVSVAFAAPKTPNLHIHVYLSDEDGNQALEDGIIDIAGWSLSKEWVNKWTLMFQTISMQSYDELNMFEIDLNSQRWPTGDSGSKFYDSARTQSVKAVEFRKAIACLVDREAIIRDVLGGYGHRMDVPILPSQSAYIDMPNYTFSGVIYDFNRMRAVSILDAAGFTIGLDGETRIDPLTGDYLSPLTFYIRTDDANMEKMGRMLKDELVSIGIPVNAIMADKIVCFKKVMVLYNYNLYTGGWNLGPIPKGYYDFYSSSKYYGPDIGWSENYPGFCNAEFDGYAIRVEYPMTLEDVQEASRTCGYLFLKYCAVVPIYCPEVVKAYRTGWTGVVNDLGHGIDNYFSFLNMDNSGDDTIDWGFKENITTFNVIGAEANLWGWASGDYWGCTWEQSSDSRMLNLIYEGLLDQDPFSQAYVGSGLVENYTLGSWDATSYSGDPDASVLTFHIRNNVTFHNVTGGARKPVDAYVISFSFSFTANSIPNCWCHPLVGTWAEVVDNYTIKFYHWRKSPWILYWVGSFRIINPDIWSKVGSGYQARLFDPAKSDINNNGIIDIMEDGTGAWTFAENASDVIRLVRDDNYYLSSVDVENQLKQMFWADTGDVSRDCVVNILDLSYMARSLGRTTSDPHGSGWNQYNVDCDLNNDGKIDYLDLAVTSVNYGRTMG